MDLEIESKLGGFGVRLLGLELFLKGRDLDLQGSHLGIRIWDQEGGGSK